MTVIALTVALACSIPLWAAPVHADGVHRVGVIVFAAPFLESLRGLRDGLNDLGLKEGEDIVYFVENLNGDTDGVEKALARFDDRNVEVVFATTTPVVQEINRLRDRYDFPVVFNEVADPVASNLVDSLAEPGRRTTGVSHVAFLMLAKRLQIFHECFPTLDRYLAFMDPGEQYSKDQLLFLGDAVRQLGVNLEVVDVHSRNDIKTAIERIAPDRKTGIFMLVDTMVMGSIDLLIKASRDYRVPLMVLDNQVTASGGTIGYSPSFYGVGYQSASIISLVVHGVDAGRIPVQYPDTVELVINRRLVEALDLELDPACYIYADKVIK